MKPIFLVGYMGCGKSTLGRKLAQRLKIPFFDTDKLIEEHMGATVADLFQYEGEERFREVERRVLSELIGENRRCVISTGGGLPIWSNNMELMKESGLTVYLKRSAGQIARRLTPYGRRKRPRLRGLNESELVVFMTHNMAEREPFYVKAALMVDCESLSDAEIVDVVLQEISNGK